jgi:hypothetical protein
MHCLPFHLSVPSHDTSEHISERQRYPEGSEWISRNELDELVIRMFDLTHHTDGGMTIGPSVWCFGFARIFDHRGIDEQRAGQDEWASGARLRSSKPTVCPGEFAWWGAVRSDRPYKHEWAYRFACARDNAGSPKEARHDETLS